MLISSAHQISYNKNQFLNWAKAGISFLSCPSLGLSLTWRKRLKDAQRRSKVLEAEINWDQTSIWLAVAISSIMDTRTFWQLIIIDVWNSINTSCNQSNKQHLSIQESSSSYTLFFRLTITYWIYLQDDIPFFNTFCHPPWKKLLQNHEKRNNSTTTPPTSRQLYQFTCLWSTYIVL